jgi:acetyltransferase-like isoleucine patch superfamily enzyme
VNTETNSSAVARVKYKGDILKGTVLRKYWPRFWMRHAGLGFWGRMAMRFAAWFAPPHKARPYLAGMNPKGYIAASATLYHNDFRPGSNVFVDERVVIFQREKGGPVKLGDRVCIFRDTILETGYGGFIRIGRDSGIHPRCQLNAYVSPIQIGSNVMIAPNCAFYSYDHGIAPGELIIQQPLQSKGAITIGDDVWIGVGVIVLGGVKIGRRRYRAGSVVTRDIPDGAVAVGSRPAEDEDGLNDEGKDHSARGEGLRQPQQ